MKDFFFHPAFKFCHERQTQNNGEDGELFKPVNKQKSVTRNELASLQRISLNVCVSEPLVRLLSQDIPASLCRKCIKSVSPPKSSWLRKCERKYGMAWYGMVWYIDVRCECPAYLSAESVCV